MTEGGSINPVIEVAGFSLGISSIAIPLLCILLL